MSHWRIEYGIRRPGVWPDELSVAGVGAGLSYEDCARLAKAHGAVVVERHVTYGDWTESTERAEPRTPYEVLTLLNERAILPRVGLSMWREMDRDILALRAGAGALSSLFASLDAVRALHVGTGWMNATYKDDRRKCAECGEAFPCPTIQALPAVPGPDIPLPRGAVS